MHCYLHALMLFHYSLFYQTFCRAMRYKIHGGQFEHHLYIQPPYRMFSVCGRSELGRLLTKKTDLPIWNWIITVNTIWYQCQTVFGGNIQHGLYRSFKANSSTGTYTFGSQTARQIFVYLLQTEYKQLQACTWSNSVTCCVGVAALLVCLFANIINFGILVF